MDAAATAEAGLYIHIPFCRKKCAYCDFFSVADLSLTSAVVKAIVREMELLERPAYAFDTIYLGGGTPSVLTPPQIHLLVQSAFDNFDFHDDVEITIEVNPNTADTSDFREYLTMGINRINIGVQSFSNAALRFLGRIHMADEAKSALAHARMAGFHNLGLDLIYGLPGQIPEFWRKDLEQAVGFSPEHLSCYSLTYEQGTPLEKKKAAGEVQALEEDKAAKLFKIMQDVLEQHGYEQYEIANFARIQSAAGGAVSSPSCRSRHNQKYWTAAPYVGLGPSAHSFAEPERRWNVADLSAYLSSLESDVLPVQARETLTREQRLTETLYLELRTVEGIRIPQLEKTFKLDFTGCYGSVLEELEQQGLLELTPMRCSLTRRGMRFLDGIVALLIDRNAEATNPEGGIPSQQESKP